jgi:hypothetical protein
MYEHTPTMMIRLDMCHAGDFVTAAGKPTVAQQVADGFRTNPVSANTGIVRATDGATTGTDITFWGPDSGHQTELPKALKPDTGRFSPNTLGAGNSGNAGIPSFGQLSGLINTGGGGWSTAGYFPGGGESGEGFHSVTPNKN